MKLEGQIFYKSNCSNPVIDQDMQKEREENEKLRTNLAQSLSEKENLKRTINEYKYKMTIFQEMENQIRFLKSENEKLNRIIIDRCKIIFD